MSLSIAFKNIEINIFVISNFPNEEGGEPIINYPTFNFSIIVNVEGIFSRKPPAKVRVRLKIRSKPSLIYFKFKLDYIRRIPNKNLTVRNFSLPKVSVASRTFFSIGPFGRSRDRSPVPSVILYSRYNAIKVRFRVRILSPVRGTGILQCDFSFLSKQLKNWPTSNYLKVVRSPSGHFVIFH